MPGHPEQRENDLIPSFAAKFKCEEKKGHVSFPHQQYLQLHQEYEPEEPFPNWNGDQVYLQLRTCVEENPEQLCLRFRDLSDQEEDSRRNLSGNNDGPHQ